MNAGSNIDEDVAKATEPLRIELERCRRALGECNRRMEQMEGVFAHVTDAIFVAEPDGQIIDVNPAACLILGYSKEELLTMYPWDFVTSTSREEFLHMIRTMEIGVSLKAQRIYRCKTDDQKVTHLQLARCALAGRDLIIVTCRDITEQQQARTNLEKALVAIKKSEARFRRILDAIPTQVWCALPDGSTEFQNQRCLDYVGLSAEEAHGWGWRNALHPEDIEQYVNKWLEIKASQSPGEAEARVRRFDGEYRWFLMRIVPVRDEQGKIFQWYGTNTDIDDRKRAEQELYQSKAYLAEAQKLSRTGSFGWRVASGELIWSAETFCILGYDLAMQPTLNLLLKRVYPEDFALVQQVIDSASRDGANFDFEHRLLMSDGVVKHVHVVARANRSESGEVEFVGAVMDITDRKKAEETLYASEILARGQLHALTRTLDALASEFVADRLVEHVLRTITEQLEAHSSSVWQREEAGGMMRFEFTLEGGRLITKSDPDIAAISPSLPIESVWPWPEVFRTGKPSLLEDIRQGPDFPWRDHLLAQGIITILVVPMLIAGKVEGVIGIRFDKQRRFRAEDMDLAQALAHQAMLAMQLSRLSSQSRYIAVEAERNRMARDMHDTLAQGFTGVIVQLEAAADATSKGLTDESCRHLDRASSLARESLKEAQYSVRALRQPALEEHTLCEALESLLQKMTEGATVRAELILQGSLRSLPPMWEGNILRIGQEVLTNALRHAHASEFKTKLVFDPEEIRLELRDNGRGFDPASRYDGFGLLGIRERVEGMGGQLSIQSASGEGTTILIVLPLANIVKPAQS